MPLYFSFSEKVNFLGISIVGQSNKRGDGGIYVGSIMKGWVSLGQNYIMWTTSNYFFQLEKRANLVLKAILQESSKECVPYFVIWNSTLKKLIKICHCRGK